ncbi:biotin--[acetyl-CoA-carboxylase] ligase [Tunturibacter empetritectus]|uniref:biotin--[biotin carboxyl-carrier protein] ligase n=1 Tax=Tunturiibacter lichenicola TaxID=2051959 RepID=A0A7W8J6E2_9BACT|nr:biotin--[acetyl-CoA-carboxylase] ligase [Edaphobacter lichenicola]MBB5343500.1 BirA family biotin operon repressor/biotin-[acetyl-CoA-carboxylase] ligase [Edaphobacter lichenicola]
MADSFDLPTVVAALASTAFAAHLQHLPTVGSTNLLALEAAQAGASHGSVWVADEQTAGRGRGGHVWHSIPGDGLYLSVLLRPQIPLVDALWLSLATGLAAQAAIAAVTGLRPDIRWPNDLLLLEKKCGGILVETSSIPSRSDTPTMLRYAVIGIGINVNHADFPAEIEPFATSLRRESRSPYLREHILIELLRALDREIHLFEDELRGASTRPKLLERFEVASSWVRGKRVRVDEDGGYTGVTTGLDPRGFLRIAGDDGELHTVLSGGVRPF